MKVVRTAAAVVATGFVLAWLLLGCGASARTKTIETTVNVTKIARDSFVTWDRQHELDIATSCGPTKEDCHVALDKWQAEQLKVQKLITSIFEAAAIALTVNDSRSFANLGAAALLLSDELHTLGVLK